jgi:hypothetical protein
MFMGLPYATLPNTENSWFEVGLDLEYFPNHHSSTKVVDTPTEAHSSPLSTPTMKPTVFGSFAKMTRYSKEQVDHYHDIDDVLIPLHPLNSFKPNVKFFLARNLKTLNPKTSSPSSPKNNDSTSRWNTNGDMYSVQREMAQDEIRQGGDLQEVCFIIIIIIHFLGAYMPMQ